MARDDFGGRSRDREGGRDRDDYERSSGSERYDAGRRQEQGDERDPGYGGRDREDRLDTSGRAGIGGGMGREGGGRYAGRPEDDARAMRYDREDYESGRGRQGEYGQRGGGVSGRGGISDFGARDLGGRDEVARGYGMLDRNPGQGFGAFGWSNADERGDQVRGTGAQGSFAGRGPRNYQRSDERIRDDICERLTRHHDIDASDIDIQVSKGVVTLSGTVDDKHTKRMAEDVAEEVMGIVEVRNELRTQRSGLLGGLFGGSHDRDRADREVQRSASREGAPDLSVSSETSGSSTSPRAGGAPGTPSSGTGASATEGTPGRGTSRGGRNE